MSINTRVKYRHHDEFSDLTLPDGDEFLPFVLAACKEYFTEDGVRRATNSWTYKPRSFWTWTRHGYPRKVYVRIFSPYPEVVRAIVGNARTEAKKIRPALPRS